MKSFQPKSVKVPLCIIIFLILFAGITLAPAGAENIARKISVWSCDSLIKANEKNPDFVILDVRTPGVWIADHLLGSINRNYYDADYSAQIGALPRHKTYLMHCQAGSRSAPTLTLMKNLSFREVYEMAGGISAWKSAGLPTTSLLAPRLMLVSVDGAKTGMVRYGSTDTLRVTITNRANDTLRFTSLAVPPGDEFTSDFNIIRKLSGAEDYSFSIYYSPKQQNSDSVHFLLHSNGGDLQFTVFLKSAVTQEILLNAGWNIFSVNVIPDIPDLKILFNTLINDGSLIKIQDETGNSLENYGVFGGWINNIGNVQHTEGYKIKVSRNCSFIVTGTPRALPCDIPLNGGWNIIGYPSSSERDGMSVVQQLIDRGTLIKVQDETGKSIENFGTFGGWMNNIGSFKPGEGYKIKVTTAETLTLP